MVNLKSLAGIGTVTLLLALGAAAGPVAIAAGPTRVDLGNADDFAVLAAAGVTNAHAAGETRSSTAISGHIRRSR